MNKDNLRTPINIFEKCVDLFEYGIPYLDTCATNKTQKIPYCKTFISPEYNALNTNWYNPYRLAWCNPPHSQNRLFFLKAIEQAKQKITKTIMLLPLNILANKYFHENKKYCKVEFLEGRIKFLYENGEVSKHPSRNGYCTILIK